MSNMYLNLKLESLRADVNVSAFRSVSLYWPKSYNSMLSP